MSEKQRVLIAARWPVGGIRTYLRYIFRHPALAPYDYKVIAPEAEGLQVALADFAAPDVEHISTSQSDTGFFRRAVSVIRQRKPVLIHSHGFTSATLLAPMAWVTRTPHLVTIHDVLFPSQFAGLKGRLKRWTVGWALRSADHVMAVGEEALANLRAFYPALAREGKSSAIRNGIEPALFRGDQRRDLHRELGLDREVTLIGFFGRFMAQKGFSSLVEAVARLRDNGYRVQVACFGWGGFIREEQKALQRRGLMPFFHFLSQTEDMVAALRGVDVVTIPSRWEACPLLPMEALMAGAPLITSDCIGMNEVVVDSPAAVFPTDDVNALADRIATVAADRAANIERSEAFREEACRRFNSERSATALQQLYCSLLKT